jgi:hypothetical protein
LDLRPILLQRGERVVARYPELELLVLKPAQPNALSAITMRKYAQNAFVRRFKIVSQLFWSQSGGRFEHPLLRPGRKVELVPQNLANGHHTTPPPLSSTTDRSKTNGNNAPRWFPGVFLESRLAITSVWRPLGVQIKRVQVFCSQ